MPQSGLLSWTEIAQIIAVHTVSNCCEAAFLSKLMHGFEQLILAVEAAHSIVTHVCGPLHLLCLNNLHRYPLLLGERESVLKLGPRQTRRIGNHGQHVLAQHSMSNKSQIS